MIIAAYAVAGTPWWGISPTYWIADALGHKDSGLGGLFAIVLLDASIIGASAITLATSYAFGDVFGIKHLLHRSFRDAQSFYASYAALVVVAVGIVLIPNAPLGLVTEAVQALAGLLLPTASVFLLLLCKTPKCSAPGSTRAGSTPWPP
jgi:Mn2+/Fe2+ NRAMP family transporter